MLLNLLVRTTFIQKVPVLTYVYITTYFVHVHDKHCLKYEIYQIPNKLYLFQNLN